MGKSKPYEIHEAAKIMPAMSDAEYRALRDDIGASGLKNPALLLDGKILDGVHRQQACIDTGVTLRTVDVKLNGQSPAEFVLSMNLHRRHLTTSQRSIVAANLANLGEGRPGKTAPNGAVSQEEAAEALNVSRRNVQRATVVVEEGAKVLQEAVAAGEVPVNVAAEIAELPKSEQAAAVKAGKEGIKRAVAKVRKKKEKAKAKVEKDAPEELTFEQEVAEENKQIESFCRGLVAHFNDNCPKLTWTEDSGRIGSALAGVKAACETLRTAKAVVCPACTEGQAKKGKCGFCKGHGYLPAHIEKTIPESEKL